MVGHGELSRPESDYGSAEEDVKGRALDVTGMVVEEQGTFPSPPIDRGQAAAQSSRQAVAAAMELDGQDESPFSAATSSSIPSSSRSSLRSARPPARDRTASLSFSNPKLAAPKVDRSSASGEGAAWRGEEKDGDSEAKGHDHQSGHLLRHLVGGIFHRRKSHSDQPPRHPHEEPRLSSLVPSKPLTSHRPPKIIQPSSDRPLASTALSQPRIRSSARSTSHTRSPGIAKPVTPRVRTRDERSIESLRGDRAGIGTAVGSLAGVTVGDREERRARLE